MTDTLPPTQPGSDYRYIDSGHEVHHYPARFAKDSKELPVLTVRASHEGQEVVE